jgi:hypothetical protein
MVDSFPAKKRSKSDAPGVDGGGASARCSSGVAAESEREGGAYLSHPQRVERGDAPPYDVERDRHDVVQVDDARVLHSVFDTESNLGRYSSGRRSYRSDGHCGEVFERGRPGEDENRSLLVRVPKADEVDVAPF